MNPNTIFCYIATPVDMNNYGNRLQNFAVHWMCNKMNLVPVTLVSDNHGWKARVKNSYLRIASLLHLERITRRTPKLSVITKQILATRFTNKYTSTQRLKDEEDLKRIIKPSDYVGIGGDQIWSKYWRNKVWFSQFASVDPSRKICFAPSFGGSTIPDDHKDVIKADLISISYPAVREESGVGIIEELTGKKAARICDPVVQLSYEEWNEYCKEITPLRQKKGKYIFLYFLGSVSDEKYKWINQIKEEYNLNIIDVSRGNASEAIDPFDFLTLIRDSFLVCTDSFHAIMIALIMKSKMVIFEREGGERMNTRINEIVERYGLELCVYRSGMNGFAKNMPVADVEYIQSVLQEEREKGYEYYKSIVGSI